MPFDPLANTPEYYGKKLTPYQLQHDYGYGVGQGPYGEGKVAPDAPGSNSTTSWATANPLTPAPGSTTMPTLNNVQFATEPSGSFGPGPSTAVAGPSAVSPVTDYDIPQIKSPTPPSVAPTAPTVDPSIAPYSQRPNQYTSTPSRGTGTTNTSTTPVAAPAANINRSVSNGMDWATSRAGVNGTATGISSGTSSRTSSGPGIKSPDSSGNVDSTPVGGGDSTPVGSNTVSRKYTTNPGSNNLNRHIY